MNKSVTVIRPTKTLVNDNGVVNFKKKKVAAYARVSTDLEDQINSYKVQCDEYTNVIRNNPEYFFVGVFADQGISGTQAKKRPEFMKMIQSARDGNIDLILTKSISRFARNTVDTITYVRELRELNVEVFFEKENISSLDPKIDFMLTILSSIAQEESRAISTNVKWAYDKKFKNGIVDARRMYGFDAIDNKFVIIPEEAAVVQKIFELALKRYKITDIVKSLTVEGHETINKKPWTYGTVRSILTNEKYCGDAILRKTVTIDYLTKKSVKNDNIADKYYVSDNHEAIISKDTFDSVQIILNDKVLNGRNMNKSTKYPLTGILICPKCGRSLKRQQVNPGKNMRIVLNCNHSYGNDHICNSTKPDYDIILGAAYDSIKEIYANGNVLNNLFEVFDNNVASNTLRNSIQKLRSENDNLMDLYEVNGDNVDIYNQIQYNNEKIKILEGDLVTSATSSVRLEYIKSLVKDEQFSKPSILLKDIYSLVIADEQKVIFVISSKKGRPSLINSYMEIIQAESILSKMYIDTTKNKAIYYEVKLYD